MQDARGASVGYSYDGKGRLLSETIGTSAIGAMPAINSATRYEYDASDRIAKIRRHDNSLAYQASYDGLGRLTSEIDGAGQETKYGYDNARNYLLSLTLGAQNVSEQQRYTFTYDRLGRRNRQIADPTGLNLITDFRYTDTGSTDTWNLQQVIDPNGGTTHYRYTGLGELERVIDALGNITRYSYDKLGNLKHIFPAVGAQHNYTTDLRGQVIGLGRDGKGEAWRYFPDGLLRSMTDYSDQTINYLYDNTGRLTSIDYAGTVGDVGGARSDASFSYAANDQLLSATSKPDGITAESTSYAYDAANRLINRTRGGRTVGYGYDANNRLSAMHYWLQAAVDYGYGAAGSDNGQLRSLGVRDGAGNTVTSSFAYSGIGALKQITRPNATALVTGLSYDTAGRLLGIGQARAGVPVQGVSYTLDRNSNRTLQTESLNVGAGVAAFTTSYGYDALNRLISVDAAAMANQPRQTENYTYDAAGNRKTIISNRPSVTSVSTGDLNGDGVSDLYFRENQSTAAGALMLGGNLGLTVGSAANAGVVVQSADWEPKVMADFAGVGRSSVLWRNKVTGENYSAQLGGKDGSRSVAFSIIDSMAGMDWNPEASADFNSDGVPDVLWRNASTGAIVVLTMGGAGGVKKMAEFWLPTESNTDWRVRASGDFNRDGKPDVLWRNHASGGNRVWIMGGSNNTQVIASANLPSDSDCGWDLIGTADQDKDGTVDLIWQNQAGAMRIWYMDSKATNSETIRETQSIVNPLGSLGVGP